MDLSIIIPVYNTAKNDLIRCFNSIDGFCGVSHEAIIVDDGSEMNTAMFCREYAESHEMFSYVRQQNMGVSSARNAGMHHAKGKYILFVDADDELIAKELAKKHLDSDAQIIFYDYEVIEVGHCRKWVTFESANDTWLTKKEYYDAACRNRINSSWAKLYLRTFLEEKGIVFDQSMVFAEDAKFVFQAVSAADRVYYVNNVLYRYYHSFENGDKRLLRFPETVVRNSVMLYDMRRELLDKAESVSLFAEEELEALRISVHKRVISDLFEATGSLLLMGRFNNSINQIIQPVAIQVYEAYCEYFGVKTRIKSFLLSRDWRFAVKSFAYLREIYIRVRR